MSFMILVKIIDNLERKRSMLGCYRITQKVKKKKKPKQKKLFFFWKNKIKHRTFKKLYHSFSSILGLSLKSLQSATSKSLSFLDTEDNKENREFMEPHEREIPHFSPFFSVQNDVCIPSALMSRQNGLMMYGDHGVAGTWDKRPF